MTTTRIDGLQLRRPLVDGGPTSPVSWIVTDVGVTVGERDEDDFVRPRRQRNSTAQHRVEEVAVHAVIAEGRGCLLYTSDAADE